MSIGDDTKTYVGKKYRLLEIRALQIIDEEKTKVESIYCEFVN